MDKFEDTEAIQDLSFSGYEREQRLSLLTVNFFAVVRVQFAAGRGIIASEAYSCRIKRGLEGGAGNPSVARSPAL